MVDDLKKDQPKVNKLDQKIGSHTEAEELHSEDHQTL